MIMIINLVVAIVLIFISESVAGQQDVGRWVQVGNTIQAPGGSKYFGRDVAMSAQGTTIAAAGASYGTTVAQIMKYNEMSRTWEQLGSNIDDGSSFISLSADGTIVVVTNIFYIPSDDDGSANFDYSVVRVFKFGMTSKEWEMVGSSFRSDVTSHGYISADGTTLAIQGKYVRVYKLHTNPSLQWVQIGEDIFHEGPTYGSIGGIALSANGMIIAIGNIYTKQNSGHVRVYKLYPNPAPRWVQLGLDIDGEANGDESGTNVAMSYDGTTIAIGSLYNGSGSGHVRVYKIFRTPLRWMQLGSDINGEASWEYYSFGLDLSSDGTTVVIGVNGYGGDGSKLGYVRVYKFHSLQSSWLKVGSDLGPPTNFGTSVAISADGTSIVVGSGGNQDPISGKVRVYKFTPNEQIGTCIVKWDLYNSRSNTLVGTLRNGTIVTNPPPCNYTNIQAVISSCTVTNNTVVMKLYSHDMKRLIRRHVETGPKFYLYGNDEKNNDVYDGRIYPGMYNLQVKVNGIHSTPTTFTLRDTGGCS